MQIPGLRRRAANLAQTCFQRLPLLLEVRDRLAMFGAMANERYVLPLMQQQIADHVGLTTVHVSRVLRSFRELDMVAVQRSEVVFLNDVGALEALARPVQDLVGE